ncbi:dihydrofolate synthetase [Ananas comosus]|uniref:Dihydrofolate synthetase n=1 Tax=Ananas comosus TaxID=4615 RepID=A0A6P5FVM0_ANACO|nr:dihydrofolate synthetase [Ananas comosus]
MLHLPKMSYPICHLGRRGRSSCSSLISQLSWRRLRSSSAMARGGEGEELGGFSESMERLRNYERIGVPRGAGTDSGDGFDLGRMRRLLRRLGDPHALFKAVHIAGTKGKGSSAAFLSNILREGGYKVGCYTSPHLLTIRERISLGRNGDPVSAELLRDTFHGAKGVLDQSIELENGALTHFEVFTALAFLLFSQEKVDIAIIEAGLGGARDATNVIRNSELAASVLTSIGEEHLAALGGSLESVAMAKSGIIKQGRPVIIGGPLEEKIERIIKDRASVMNSPVISACDPGIRSILKCFARDDDEPRQTCDIVVDIQKDMKLSIKLHDLKLHMLGAHQLQNAVTATCTALCLSKQGWRISDASIRAGLERTKLHGRNQFLTQKEASAFGLQEVSLLVDGAHTEASAKGLSDVIRMAHPDGPLALVVAMASDKDHLAFAQQLLSGRRPDIVLLTETSISGGKSRTSSASALKNIWIKAAQDLSINLIDLGAVELHKLSKDNNCSFVSMSDNETMLIGYQVAPVNDSIRVCSQLLQSKEQDQNGLIVVTGSLHIVSSLLAAVYK